MGSFDRGFPTGGRLVKRCPALVIICSAFIAAILGNSADGARGAEIVAPATSSNDGTALMRRVAAAYALDVAGVVAVRSHSDLAIKAPIFGRHIVDDNWYVFKDGDLAASSHKADPRQPPLHDPYRIAYLSEYSYRIVACPTCAPGTSAIAYESATRDVAHAHGTFVVNTATAHIISGSETPYRLPWPTKSGELVASWAESSYGWFPIRVDGAFVGNIGPFVGRASYAQTNTVIERFATVTAAKAALIANTGLPAAPDVSATTNPTITPAMIR